MFAVFGVVVVGFVVDEVIVVFVFVVVVVSSVWGWGGESGTG